MSWLRSFPLVLQRDAMQCGVASLCMILQFHNKIVGLEELDKICQPTTEGVSIRAICECAKQYGVHTTVGMSSLEELFTFKLPAIIHWNQNHFVVLYKISKNGGKFYLADPAKGKVNKSLEEFKKGWLGNGENHSSRGVIMVLEPQSEESKPRTILDHYFFSHIRSFSILFKYLRAFKAQLIKIIFLLTIASCFQLILPFLTQSIVDFGIRNKDISFIWLILLGEFMIVIGRTVTDFIRRRLLLHVSMKVNINFINDFFVKLLKLPISFFDKKLIGDIMQRIGDHGRVQNFLTGQLLNILFTVFTFIVFTSILFIYDTMIFIVFIIGSIIHGIWISLFLKRRKVIDCELFECYSRNQNSTYQFVTSIQEIKLQNCEKRRREEWDNNQNDLLSLQLKSLKLQQNQEAGSVLITEIKNILITVLTATAVINGFVTLGEMLAVQYIIGQLNTPIEQIMNFIYAIQDLRISLERINEIHQGKDEDSEEGIRAFENNSGILINRISFRYDIHARKNILENISFSIPNGEVTAIVGTSGSGKSTLLKLILGYYSALTGTIKIAGLPIEKYSLKWWRQQCGVVMQDGVIFSESIARNIAVGDGEIDFKRMEEAAKLACIHDHIARLPLGYNTKIGSDGMGLSQGQKQRILIARAVYKNPKYLFFDEATNALDARNEREIVSNLERFYEGRTVIIVAHRLSTVKNADQIVVVDQGNIVETGTHNDLIEKKGYYYNLIKNQLELGI